MKIHFGGKFKPCPYFQPSGSEAAKFRLWVKSKGFTLGPATPGRPGGVVDVLDSGGGDVLYLPTGTDKVSESWFARRVPLRCEKLRVCIHIFGWRFSSYQLASCAGTMFLTFPRRPLDLNCLS